MLQGYCHNCERNVSPKHTGTNHIVNLLLTLITAGLWLIVWLILAATQHVYTCPICGSVVSKREQQCLMTAKSNGNTNSIGPIICLPPNQGEMDGSWLAFPLRMNQKQRGLSDVRLRSLFAERDNQYSSQHRQRLFKILCQRKSTQSISSRIVVAYLLGRSTVGENIA